MTLLLGNGTCGVEEGSHNNNSSQGRNTVTYIKCHVTQHVTTVYQTRKRI